MDFGIRGKVALVTAASKGLGRGSAEALSADVSRLLRGEPPGAYREGLLERGLRLAFRYRTPILLVLAYMVMRVVLILFFGR